MEYLLILFIFGIFQFAIFLYVSRGRVHWKSLFLTIVSALVVGLIADYIAVKRGIWWYTVGNGKTIGLQFLGIPFEDFVFIITLTAWVVGCYEFIKNKFEI